MPAHVDAVLERIVATASGAEPAGRKAEIIAGLIREARRYRWVGLYRVGTQEIGVLGWSGPGAPAHPHFPIDQGLSGAAVSTRRPVIAGDVSQDPRYLTTFGSTRSEMVVPVREEEAQRVVGLIDVESERLNAFGDEDVAFVARCAEAARRLWSSSEPPPAA